MALGGAGGEIAIMSAIGTSSPEIRGYTRLRYSCKKISRFKDSSTPDASYRGPTGDKKAILEARGHLNQIRIDLSCDEYWFVFQEGNFI